ncbi:hypothetical protein DWY48_15400 [Clostridium butyricum]|nr:hypothetical protein DWY48_15400 [Clostridium butyricum]
MIVMELLLKFNNGIIWLVNKRERLVYMKLLLLKNSTVINESDVKELILNGNRESFSKKLLLESIKTPHSALELVLKDGSHIKEAEVKDFYFAANR